MGSLWRNGAFRRLFLGRVVTNIGDSLYTIAATWLVYDLTGSSVYTGIAGFLLFAPQTLQFLAGPLVDRWPLRDVLVGTQLVQAVCVLAVPVAAVTATLSVWIVLLLVPVLALLNQFVYPAQHAALPRIVDEADIVEANSAFAFAYQGTELAFNALAGVLIAIIGAVAMYLLDAVTFAVATLLFVGMVIDDDNDDRPATNDGVGDYRSRLREGFDYVHGSALEAMLLGGMVVNFTYGVVIAVLPAVAASFGGARSYGLLMAAIAAGNLGGAAVASRIETQPYGRLAVVGYATAGLCWAGALLVSGLAATTVLVFAAFVPMGALSVVFWSMLQAAVEGTMLGRVSSIASSLSVAMMPVGSLLGGTAATLFGETPVMYSLVGTLLLLGLFFLAKRPLRRLPSPVDADETTLGLGTESSS